MVAFPNCKINLGLNVVRKRSDGFHDIETIFYPLPLYDAIEVITSPGQTEEIKFSTSGDAGSLVRDQNLCVRAYELLKKDFPTLPPVRMHLHKTIPIGAGLGGGSSDAAFTLKLLNQLFELGLATAPMLNYALTLGSDCPFFMVNKPCFATGRGEKLQPLDLGLSRFKLLLVNPGINVKTAEVFSMVVPAIPTRSISDIIRQPVESWKGELTNDFETPVFRQYPQIKSIKEDLYNAGAIYASMSGTGSTVYGIFERNQSLQFSFPASYFIKELVGEMK